MIDRDATVMPTRAEVLAALAEVERVLANEGNDLAQLASVAYSRSHPVRYQRAVALHCNLGAVVAAARAWANQRRASDAVVDEAVGHLPGGEYSWRAAEKYHDIGPACDEPKGRG